MSHGERSASREQSAGQEPGVEEREEAIDLPDREAMSILDVMPTGIGGLGLPTSPTGGLGIPNRTGGVALPTQGVPGAELPQPDPSMPYQPAQQTTTTS